MATQEYGFAGILFTAVIVGVGCGLVNGLLVAYGGMVPFIATLAMLASARGLALQITDGKTQIVTVDGILNLGERDSYVLGIPPLVLVFAVVTVIGWLVLNRTTFGRRTVAVGGNAEAARLAGAADLTFVVANAPVALASHGRERLGPLDTLAGIGRGEVVLLHADGPAEVFVIALDERTGEPVGFESSALTRTEVPGVLKTAPRGEFTLKKLPGRSLGAAKLSGTPSQLISRRPFGNEPTTLGFRTPRSVRY